MIKTAFKLSHPLLSCPLLSSTMEHRKEKNGWMSVPEFGGWDRKTPGATDYSMVFSRARANKKQQKNEITRRSLGNEHEFIAQQQHQQQQDDSVMRKKKVLTYLNCCIRP
uniref:Putative RPM1-interacting protein 4 (RIN4) family protein n=1 Tax=Davidia involucrata TaxID=16924 RepID=A0A5B6YNY8_DAVIN